jgi:hypothetical protein
MIFYSPFKPMVRTGTANGSYHDLPLYVAKIFRQEARDCRGLEVLAKARRRGVCRTERADERSVSVSQNNGECEARTHWAHRITNLGSTLCGRDIKVDH